MNKAEKKTLSPDQTRQLSDFRQQIDDVDDEIIELLIRRIGIVSRVGEMKRQAAPGQCPLRPGREADMVRRVAQKFEGSAFPPAAAAALWRVLIGASTAVEVSVTLSVYTPEKNDALYWMAREYFGPFISITRQPHIKRVIGDVLDGKASIGLVPPLHSPDESHWWTNLIQPDADMPVIFAHVPFVYYETPGPHTPSALAIGCITPEETQEDESILVLETEHNVSQHRLQTAFAQANLQAQWLDIATLTPNARHHLIKIKGFMTSKHAGMQNFLKALGAAILNVTYLGAYAAPFTLSFSHSSQPSAVLHAS